MKTLDLLSNNFGKKTGKELVEVFSAIPRGVISLDLSGNRLSKISIDDLKSLIVLLPKTMRSLDLTDNGFDVKTGWELLEPLVQQTLDMDEIAEFIVTLILTPLKPPFSIDEDGREIIVAELERQATPLGYFICGLLLEGLVESFAANEESNSFDSRQARLLRAIKFYLKAKHASEDPAIKEMVDFTLWNMKIRSFQPHDFFIVFLVLTSSVKYTCGLKT